jgi:nucleoside-diphosphate-sugar epimerase
MDVLLTGGSGDLGAVLTRHLTARKDTALRFDVRPPRDPHGTYVPGSILDRDALAQAVRGVACIVHIAAWHGIHEHNQSKDAYDFWELNVRGTFEVCETAARAGVRRLVLISSTSVSKPESVYGHSKVLSEQVAAGYAVRHGMGIVVLRPRRDPEDPPARTIRPNSPLQNNSSRFRSRARLLTFLDRCGMRV